MVNPLNICEQIGQFLLHYANANMKLVKRNQELHNPDSPLLIVRLKMVML